MTDYREGRTVLPAVLRHTFMLLSSQAKPIGITRRDVKSTIRVARLFDEECCLQSSGSLQTQICRLRRGRIAPLDVRC